MKAVTNNVEW